MQYLNNDDSARQINNLVARIKSRYPNLYEETGGKYIRKILRKTLVEPQGAPEEIESHEPLSASRETRVIKHKHAQKRAA